MACHEVKFEFIQKNMGVVNSVTAGNEFDCFFFFNNLFSYEVLIFCSLCCLCFLQTWRSQVTQYHSQAWSGCSVHISGLRGYFNFPL